MTEPAAPGRTIGWAPLGVLVLAQIGYPLTHGPARADLVIATVVLGFGISLAHAARTRGWRVALAVLGAMTAVGGLVEAVGVHTGHPFGGYGYAATLGPSRFGVPIVIPLAWTWLGWPAWLAAARLTSRAVPRVAIAAFALASWDLFLDPQMVAAGYWTWAHPRPALPGVAGVPLTNYAGWLVVAAVMMALFATVGGPAARRRPGVGDAPMFAMYLWTYAGSLLAHAIFLGLPGSAAWGSLGMGIVAVPLAVALSPAADRSGARIRWRPDRARVAAPDPATLLPHSGIDPTDTAVAAPHLAHPDGGAVPTRADRP